MFSSRGRTFGDVRPLGLFIVRPLSHQRCRLAALRTLPETLPLCRCCIAYRLLPVRSGLPLRGLDDIVLCQRTPVGLPCVLARSVLARRSSLRRYWRRAPLSPNPGRLFDSPAPQTFRSKSNAGSVPTLARQREKYFVLIYQWFARLGVFRVVDLSQCGDKEGHFWPAKSDNSCQLNRSSTLASVIGAACFLMIYSA